MLSEAEIIGRHVFRSRGDTVVIEPHEEGRTDRVAGVGIRRDVLCAFVVQVLGRDFAETPSELRSILLTETDLPSGLLAPDHPDLEGLILGATGFVSVYGEVWDPEPTSGNVEMVVAFPSLLSYVLSHLSDVMAENVRMSNRREAETILLALLGGTHRGMTPLGIEPEAAAVPAKPLEWRAPAAKERPSYEAVWEALDELRDAASALQTEIGGTVMHLRAHRRLAELHEPLRKAWCVLNDRPYAPLPDADTGDEAA